MPMSKPPSPKSVAVNTLVQMLQTRAREEPSAKLYTWLINGESEGRSLSCGELDTRASSIAAKLQSLNSKQGSALLLYPPGLEFIEALFGCFYAGIIAVPAYVPVSNRSSS